MLNETNLKLEDRKQLETIMKKVFELAVETDHANFSGLQYPVLAEEMVALDRLLWEIYFKLEKLGIKE